MWNFALDGSGNPKLPGTDSCAAAGCRPIVTVNSDGSYSYNQECTRLYYSRHLTEILHHYITSVYSMAHASKAVIPKDAGGPWGQMIGVSVTGSLAWTLRVNAFVIKRLSSTDSWQYTLVVMNCKYLRVARYT